MNKKTYFQLLTMFALSVYGEENLFTDYNHKEIIQINHNSSKKELLWFIRKMDVKTKEIFRNSPNSRIGDEDAKTYLLRMKIKRLLK